MKLRIIDYVANEGGGVRFTIEMIRELYAARPSIEIELGSAGAALERYAALISANGLPCRVYHHAPLSCADDTTFTLGGDALTNCDKLWLPWGHRHRLAEAARQGTTVVTLHDLLVMTVPELRRAHRKLADAEHGLIDRWLRSAVDVVVSSFHTLSEIERVFARPATNVHVISLAGSHASVDAEPARPLPAGLVERRFMLCPFNISPHKNHELLFRALHMWSGRMPAVLTGGGTDLADNLPGWKRAVWPIAVALGLRSSSRGLELRRMVERLGLHWDQDIYGMGYVSDPLYYSLLRQCWAVVMPTLGEGGGSFPVEEALWIGKPVISADIPVMREQMQRLNADVLWFDPARPEELLRRLDELAQDYRKWAVKFEQQVASMRQRTWADTIEEYLPLLADAG